MHSQAFTVRPNKKRRFCPHITVFGHLDIMLQYAILMWRSCLITEWHELAQRLPYRREDWFDEFQKQIQRESTSNKVNVRLQRIIDRHAYHTWGTVHFQGFQFRHRHSSRLIIINRCNRGVHVKNVHTRMRAGVGGLSVKNTIFTLCYTKFSMCFLCNIIT